jgi:hypothetical protein
VRRAARHARAKAVGRVASCALLVAVAASPVRASAAALQPPQHAARASAELRRDPKYAFCTKPRRPLGPQQSALCPLAAELEGCEGLRAACDVPTPKPERSDSWLDGLVARLGVIAQALVWVLVGAVALLVVIPVLRALLRARREREADRPDERRPVEVRAAASADEPVATGDAASLLSRADELARAGEHARSLSLYLSASLSALDARGAIRLARHRTNGEYVRACADASARGPLRDIVREVDGVEFGGRAATAEVSTRARSRAAAIVRATGVATLLLGVVGCGGLHKPGTVDDPAGGELGVAVLRAQGLTVSKLDRSIATLPMPARDELAPVVVVDMAQTVLEDDAMEHVMRWVREGGVLVLFGAPSRWPRDVGAAAAPASSRELRWVWYEDEDDDDASAVAPIRGQLARGAALRWTQSAPLVRVGDATYAGARIFGRGRVVGVATSELLTNVSVAHGDNAAMLAAIVQGAASPFAAAFDGVPDPGAHRTIKIARPEDGIPPPGNPFAALSRAGLDLGLWHAIVAAALLFAAYGVRHARARRAPPPNRRAFLEHVRATGAFWRRARADGVALASYARFVEERLREEARGAHDPTLLLATRAESPVERVAAVWEKATAARARPDERRAADLGALGELVRLARKALRGRR